MIIGIIGCGAISKIIVNHIQEEDNITFKYFFDKDLKEAENLASKTNGVSCENYTEMLDKVDLILEAASQEFIKAEGVNILKHTNLLNMSIGALMDKNLLTSMLKVAKENNTNLYAPSGAILGIDGLKSACIKEVDTIKLTTRKSPKSLGLKTDEEKTLFKGKASEAVQKYPKNMNIAATLSLASKRDIDVELKVDPKVSENIHEVNVKGKFGQFQIKTENLPSEENPKTSELAALSAIEKIKSLNGNLHIGN